MSRDRQQPDLPSFEALAEAIAKVIARAAADGGATGRATIDSQSSVINTLTAALESREAKIKEQEGTMKTLLDQYGSIVKANSELAVAETHARVAKMRVEADAAFYHRLLDTVGPGAKVGFPLLVKKIAGIDINIGDDKVLTGDGTKEGEGRAALWEAVMFIMGRTDILDEISVGIGPKRWELAISYLQTQYAAAQKPQEKANGVAN